MEAVGAALNKALRRLGLEKGIRERSVPLVWREVVGEWTARYTVPLWVRRGTLLVLVASSTWAQELSLMRSQLLSKLNARVGGPVVRDIRFHVSDGWPPSTGRSHEASAPGARPGGGGGLQPDPHPDHADPHLDVVAEDPQLEAEVTRECEGMSGALGDQFARTWYQLRHRARWRERQRQRLGWQCCQICQQWNPPENVGEGICRFCRATSAEEHVRAGEEALFAAPWLTPAELAARVPGASTSELALARKRCRDRMYRELQEWAARLLADTSTGSNADSGRGQDRRAEGWQKWRQRAQEYVLAATGAPMSAIGGDDVRRVLGDLAPLWDATLRHQPGGGAARSNGQDKERRR